MDWHVWIWFFFSMDVLLLPEIFPGKRRFPVQEGIFSVYIFICVIIYYRRGNFSYVLLELRQNIILHQFAKYLQTREQAWLNIHKMQVCSHENHISISKTFESHFLSENLTLMEFPGVKSPWVLARTGSVLGEILISKFWSNCEDKQDKY